MSALLRIAQVGPVLRLTMADASSRNSLSEQMMAELTQALASALDTVRVIILAAEGPAFCSGHNLKELTAHRSDPDHGAEYFQDLFGKCAALMITITNHRCPVIAEVQGLASAAGCQLVATCDLAYAANSARFCTPGVNIGLFCSTPMVALSRNVSSKNAMEMLLTGEIVSADFAQSIGLVNDVVAAEDLGHFIDVKANLIANKSATAICFGKRAFYEQRAMPLPEAYAFTSAVMAKNMLDGAACEGIDAFIAKRKPVWNTAQ